MNGAGIAVAVDGSAASRDGLAHAIDLAARATCPLTGIFVLDTGWADYIGNDWQSSAGARQGFLDYVRDQLEAQAEAARRQFEAATAGLPGAAFRVVAGDPLTALCGSLEETGCATLVFGRDVFAVCGRPSARRLARELPRRLRERVTVV